MVGSVDIGVVVSYRKDIIDLNIFMAHYWQTEESKSSFEDSKSALHILAHRLKALRPAQVSLVDLVQERALQARPVVISSINNGVESFHLHQITIFVVTFPEYVCILLIVIHRLHRRAESCNCLVISGAWKGTSAPTQNLLTV